MLVITVLLINVIVGSTMYVVEGAENGFDSMFRGVYLSIVTMSTVGFGDIAPQTALGQVLAAALMLMGYSVIAVPTGIVSAEVSTARRSGQQRRACPCCGHTEHDEHARYCQQCGADLVEAQRRAATGHGYGARRRPRERSTASGRSSARGRPHVEIFDCLCGRRVRSLRGAPRAG
ncbi:MAG: ion channel [Egibacteraceae bacterium]